MRTEPRLPPITRSLRVHLTDREYADLERLADRYQVSNRRMAETLLLHQMRRALQAAHAAEQRDQALTRR